MTGRRVLVEVTLERGAPPESALAAARAWHALGFEIDPAYAPVPMGESSAVVRGTLRADADVDALLKRPDVVSVWDDAPVAPAPQRPDE